MGRGGGRQALADGAERPPEELLPRLWPLAAVAGVLIVAGATGLAPRWAGLAHHVALPPLDLFADTRSLLAWAPSHALFWTILAGVIATRAALLAILLGRPDARGFGLAVAFYGLASLPALLNAQLVFTSHALLYARSFWIGAVVLVGTGLALCAVPWRRAAGLREALAENWRAGLRAWIVLGYLVLLLVIGALATAAGEWGGVAAVPASAALTAGTARLLSRPARRARAGRTAATATLAGVAVVGGTGFGVLGPVGAPEPPSARHGSLLLMSGVDSASGDGAILEIDPASLGYACAQTYYFSYAGPGDGQPQRFARCPITTGAPYSEEDTFRPFLEQVDALAAQAADLPPPVVVAGHSQGAWVAWHAAAQGRLPTVDTIVLVGPFPDNVGGYPPAGDPGPGRVGGDALRALVTPLIDRLGMHFEPDAPFTHQVLASPDSASSIFSRPLPAGIDALGIPAVEDLVLMPSGPDVPGAAAACPVATGHADMPADADLTRQVNAYLDGTGLPDCPAWRTTVGPLGLPFAVPPSPGG